LGSGGRGGGGGGEELGFGWLGGFGAATTTYDVSLER